jgi:hypothetical protein
VEPPCAHLVSGLAVRTGTVYNGYSPAMAEHDAIVRLARQIDATQRTERFLVSAEEAATLRRQGGCELHRVCADFVSSVNSALSRSLLDLSPPTYSPEFFRESGVNLIQISTQGRQMQIAFGATLELVSTEKFAIPYILEGEVRTYNQKMLERFEIRSQLIFFCVEKEKAVWHFFDWRTLRTGPVDRELLVRLMEPLF